MPSQSTDDLLTDAARRAVKELTDGYREAVLAEALRMAEQTGAAREIAMQDVIRAAQRVGLSWSVFDSTPRDRSSDRILSVYVVLGWVMAGGGLTLFAARELAAVLGGGTEPGLAAILPRYLPPILTIYGLLIAAATDLLRRRRAARRRLRFIESRLHEVGTTSLSQLLAHEWVGLERGLRSRASYVVGESAATMPIGEVIAVLGSSGVLTSPNLQRLREILALRNEVVHRGAAPEERAKEFLADVARIKQRLEDAALAP